MKKPHIALSADLDKAFGYSAGVSVMKDAICSVTAADILMLNDVEASGRLYGRR